MSVAVPLPPWLKRPPRSVAEARPVLKLLRSSNLHTVCEEARCPNLSHCFSRGTATFMILGDICTRGCRFCSVATGKPTASEATFAAEGSRVAQAAKQLKLKHVVVTSVARDDLPDGGASGFVHSIMALKEEIPGVTVEVLVPDFRGNRDALTTVLEAKPDVLNHNLETVPRLYRRVRPGASYQRSLSLLEFCSLNFSGVLVKTGIMLGLGETSPEVTELMNDARKRGVESFTAGQYLQPTREHLPVEEFVSLEKFDQYRECATTIGFRYVAIGPLVRSSYHADEYIG